METNKLIMFDFDGVLVRTSDLAYRLHREANPHLTDEYFEKMHDGNFWENLDRAVKEDGYVVQPDWYELYAKGLEDLTTDDLLKMLVLDLYAKYTLAVVSSMDNIYIEQALERANIRHCFAEILGADVHRSKVVKIRGLLERHALDPEHAIFITDTTGDIKEGRECGVASIGVTWGTQKRGQLETEQPFAVVDSVAELEAAVGKFFTEAG